ncbi:MAG: BMP family ABC transporter substrate-binding protein [Verrucomicrobiota bacterium]|jgi:basic membrane protein A|nr:BMP family ABC transporter substrate-binding protein [Verrucomicrobiota bacterium]
MILRPAMPMFRCVAVFLGLHLLFALLPASAEEQPLLRIAMLSDGGTFNDHSFNQNSREGIEELLYSGAPIYVQFYETTTSVDFEKQLAAFAERNYRLIIGIGFLMGPAMESVCTDYPRTLFTCVDGDFQDPAHNLSALSFQVDECAFPAGYLAAAWADLQDPEDPAVAFVGGMDVDSVNQFVVGFQNGAAHFNRTKGKNVRILGGHVGAFDQFDAGYAMAEGFLAEGADVLFGVGSISGNGAIAAAKDHGKWAIGVDTDQYNTLLREQDILLTSCLKRMDHAVQLAVQEALNNSSWPKTRYVGTLANRGVDLAPYHHFADQIPQTLHEEILDIQRNIIEGTIQTGWKQK